MVRTHNKTIAIVFFLFAAVCGCSLLLIEWLYLGETFNPHEEWLGGHSILHVITEHVITMTAFLLSGVLLLLDISLLIARKYTLSIYTSALLTFLPFIQLTIWMFTTGTAP
jgi:hypothetical protein